ncbi:MAG TPA: two-component regulator propeller domain-containing protein, partial [Patescibacteria group bacterium]|nr:two-component regulator propeller domain-containing protein [Patescibacteria group bacterium]
MAWLWPAIALVALFHCPPTEAARRYDSRDGLSENTANAIVRDELGFYWFATDTGLNRFDGRRFGAPPAPIASELEGVSIRALLVDGDALWLGTRHDGVKRIDLRRESITHLRPGDHGLPAAGITAMTLDADGRVWCATDGAGVVRIDWRDGHPEVRHYAPESSGLPHARVWSIASDGLVVLAGTEVGLATLAAGASTFELQALPAPFPAQGRANIEEIVVAAPGDYWIGTWNDGLFHVRDGAVLGGGRLGPSASARVTSLILQNGEPIAGFESGVAHYQRSCDCLRPLALAETGDRVARRAFVRALAATDDGGLMVGTWFNGVFQVPPNAAVFQRLLPAHPADTELATERVEAALEDRSGHLWIGSFGAGLQRSLATVAAGPVQFEPVPIIGNTHPGANAVWVLHEDRAGRLWVGSDGGLDRLDATRTVWTHFSANIDQRGLPGPGVRDVLELDDGRTLVATSSGLAEIGRDDAIRIIDYRRPGPDEALSRTINAVRRDRLGRIWLATHAGLIVLDPSYRILRAWQRPDLPGDLVRALHLQADGVLWIGSTQLCRIDTHAETPAPPTCLGRSDGLPEDGIQGIVAGVDGALWISSLRGLRRLAPGQAEAQAFHLGSGLVSDEFGAGAAHAGASGRLYFGSPAGLQMFDPRQVVLSRQVPRPVLTEVRIGGRSIGPSDDA